MSIGKFLRTNIYDWQGQRPLWQRRLLRNEASANAGKQIRALPGRLTADDDDLDFFLWEEKFVG